MKKVFIWILIGVGVLIVLGLTAFLIASRSEPIGVRPPTPDYSAFDLAAKVGWYEIEPEQCILISFAADGGLAIVSAEQPLFFHRLHPTDSETFRWLPGTESKPRVVNFQTEGEQVSGFAFINEEGNSEFAPRCDGPYVGY